MPRRAHREVSSKSNPFCEQDLVWDVTRCCSIELSLGELIFRVFVAIRQALPWIWYISRIPFL